MFEWEKDHALKFYMIYFIKKCDNPNFKCKTSDLKCVKNHMIRYFLLLVPQGLILSEIKYECTHFSKQRVKLFIENFSKQLIIFDLAGKFCFLWLIHFFVKKKDSLINWDIWFGWFGLVCRHLLELKVPNLHFSLMCSISSSEVPTPFEGALGQQILSMIC